MLIKNCWSNKINLIFLIWKRKIVECRISNIFKKEKKKKKKILVKHQNENKVLTIPLEYHVSRRRIRAGNNRKICTPLGVLELEAHLESGVSNRKDTRTACIAFKCLLGNQSKSFFTSKSTRDDDTLALSDSTFSATLCHHIIFGSYMMKVTQVLHPFVNSSNDAQPDDW